MDSPRPETLELLVFKNVGSGTSLVAQWMRLRAPNAGGPGSIPVRELDPTCMPQLRSLRAATKEPA